MNFEKITHPQQELPQDQKKSGFQPREIIHEKLAINLKKEIEQLTVLLNGIEDLPVYRIRRESIIDDIQKLQIQLNHLKDSQEKPE
jgi:hypothetical protein